jgi:hypothetical protein
LIFRSPSKAAAEEETEGSVADVVADSEADVEADVADSEADAVADSEADAVASIMRIKLEKLERSLVLKAQEKSFD